MRELVRQKHFTTYHVNATINHMFTYKGRDVKTADIYPNTFVQAVINDKEMGYRLVQTTDYRLQTTDYRVIMKIREPLVDMLILLLNIDSKTSTPPHSTCGI